MPNKRLTHSAVHTWHCLSTVYAQPLRTARCSAVSPSYLKATFGSARALTSKRISLGIAASPAERGGFSPTGLSGSILSERLGGEQPTAGVGTAGYGWGTREGGAQAMEGLRHAVDSTRL